MKKIIVFLLTLCLMIGILCVPTFAADDSVVMEVSGLKKDGKTIVSLNYWTKFADGWEWAVDRAGDSEFMEKQDLDRIIVDLYADWTAKENSFGSGDGFSSDGGIRVPKNLKITINMNGHTINRHMSDWDWNGEVIWVRDGADLIINGGKSGDKIVMAGTDPDAKMGTIKGGNSGNGAGGIHIDEKARVTLNNVNIIGNTADDDNGAGLAIHNNSVLTMNGGSFQDNVADAKPNVGYYGVGAYIYKATAVFNNVLFKNNQCKKCESEGSAIYSWKSDVTIEECAFEGNGIEDEKNEYTAAESLIEVAENSTVTVKNSTFIGNGDLYLEEMSFDYFDYSTLFTLSESTLIMEGECKIEDNKLIFVFQTLSDSKIYVNGAIIKDNVATVLYSDNHSADSYFKNCTLSNNFPDKKIKATESTFYIDDANFTFDNCDLGDSTFADSENVVLKDTKTPEGFPKHGASMIGEGSFNNILIILSLLCSAFSICLTVVFYKKRAGFAVANGAPEADDE